MQIPAIKGDDGSWHRNNEEKTKIFANHLSKIFTQEEDSIDELLAITTVQEFEIIKPVSPAEVAKEIKNNINTKKAPGYDLISGDVLKKLPRKAIVKLTNIINTSFKIAYVPQLWKVAEVIMIAKPGKPPHEVTSYRPISLLPVMAKLFEKLLLKRLKPVIERKQLIPDHQFGFRNQHSTIDQVHRITSVIEKALEEKKVCSTIFLDVAQAFDKVWHKGFIYKIDQMLPEQYSKILTSYISDRYFRIKQEDSYSKLNEIKAGVPQGSVLGPVLYLLYTCDLPTFNNNIIATFADDTAVMAIANTNEEAAIKLQRSINKIQDWTLKWRIKLNQTKSVHVDFTNQRIVHKPIYICNQAVPYADTAKYLGMTLDAKLRWKVHVKKKKEELEIRYRKMHWLLGRNSKLTTYNKLLLYQQVLKPIWTYGIQLWGCTKKSNIEIIQRFQNKVLRGIVDAPWYIRNSDIHRDLEVNYVEKEISKYARSHENRLLNHVNLEAIQLLDISDMTRRLKRTKPHELV